ncbi:MAG: hypothetical protein KL787_11065 [Taibaiella sp.]|nr:hypothetical protein [Taibaiella sp.]
MKSKSIFFLCYLVSRTLAGWTQAPDTDTTGTGIRTFPQVFHSDSGIVKQRPDSARSAVEVDSFLYEYQVRMNAKRAGMYAALVPGMGQVYNRQYWKLILVYGALGTSTGFIIHNSSVYNATRKEIADRNSLGYRVNPKFNLLSDYQLLQQEEYYKSNLDLSVLLTGLGYILQVMEAISANHMKDFDITPDISMRFKSSVLPNQQIGIGVAFNWK